MMIRIIIRVNYNNKAIKDGRNRFAPVEFMNDESLFDRIRLPTKYHAHKVFKKNEVFFIYCTTILHCNAQVVVF